MTKLPDISKLTPDQRRELLSQLKAANNPMADPEYVKRCLEMRSELATLCEKKGLTLAHVFTASNKAPKEEEHFKHPQTGETYAYRGKGKKPTWLAGNEDKYRIPAPASGNGKEKAAA